MVTTFFDCMYLNFFQPHITLPTRVIGGNKPSTLDNIFLNNLEYDPLSGNIIDKISDHMPNFIILSTPECSVEIGKTYTKRDYSNFNPNNFLLELND